MESGLLLATRIIIRSESVSGIRRRAASVNRGPVDYNAIRKVRHLDQVELEGSNDFDNVGKTPGVISVGVDGLSGLVANQHVFDNPPSERAVLLLVGRHGLGLRLVSERSRVREASGESPACLRNLERKFCSRLNRALLTALCLMSVLFQERRDRHV